jgi:hypothetical protein
MGVKDCDQERAGTVGKLLNGTAGNLERGNEINLMLMVALCKPWDMNSIEGRSLLPRWAGKRQYGIVVGRKKGQRLFRDIPAAIQVSMEFQPILIGNVLDTAPVFFRHGIDHLDKDFQVIVSDDYRYRVHLSAPPVDIDAERPV